MSSSVALAARDALLVEASEQQRQISYWQARQQHTFAALARSRCPDPLTPRGLDKHYVREEVSCLLGISPDSARLRLSDSVAAVEFFPELLKLLEAGETTFAHYRAFADTARPLDGEQKRVLLDLVLDKASSESINAFRVTMKKALLRVRPLIEDKNRAALAEQRRIQVIHPLEGGLSTVYADLPTEDALALAAAVEATALEWSRLSGETRTLDQLRADALVHLSTGGEQARTPITVNVCLTLDTLTNLTDQADQTGGPGVPGELTSDLPIALGGGVVPISAEHARQLAFTDPASTWRRLITDPHGQLLDYGRTVYRPPAPLARFVRARDRQCTFPHCTRPAMRCDLDHRCDWNQGGATCEHNLDCLCQRHHYLKHNSSWTVHKRPDGTRIWTSPTGRHYERPPATYPVDNSPHDGLRRDRHAPDDLNASDDHGAPEDQPPPF